MGKRAVATPVDLQQQQQPCKRSTATRSIRKRKRNAGVEAAALATSTAQHTAAAAASKTQRMSASSSASAPYWHENDDEDSSSNDIAGPPQPAPPPQRPVARQAKNHSNKQANNSSILLNSSLNTSLMADSKVLMESPKPVYTLHPSLVNGTILHDVMKKPWRLGRPIGKGNFGEIFLASDNINGPVTNENAKFVVKIEPHSNGPLFVEIHCLINTAKKTATGATDSDPPSRQSVSDSQKQPLLHPPTGIPNYIASGSHYFGDARYRFLVLQRFDRDLHSLIRNCRVHQKSVLTLAVQIVNVLENLHNKGYCHNDIKAQNLMISKCKFHKEGPTVASAAGAPRAASAVSKSLNKKFEEHYEEKQQTTDSGNSSEQETNNEEEFSDFACKQRHAAVHVKHEDAEDEDEDFDDGATSNSTNSNSMDNYKTPSQQSGRQQRQRKPFVEYSGSNPVRSCRREKRNFMYEEMVKSHYLRPTKRVSYAEFFNEDGLSLHSETASNAPTSDDDESDEFHPNARRAKKTPKSSRPKRQPAKSARKGSPKWPSTSQSVQGAAAAPPAPELLEEERIFLIDYGLASKFMDNGVHRPFVMDQRRAHDGTLEFTSRDAHMGAHSRRSDLESLGYNLLFWSQGYLPWKEAASHQQQERVHQAKEYLMADVREMLPLIYGKQVPKYLGEFLHLVGQLAYHERPDYAHYRRIFEKEFQQLGYKLAELRLNSREMSATCVQVNEEIENKNDIFEMSKHTHNAVVAGIFRSGGVGLDVGGTPFHERSLTNRVSPKNLRSKSDKKLLKKNKFSWAEILSQDPDQIARERAEKEYDREPETSEEQVVRRYEGRPTYAILEIQRLTGRLVDDDAGQAEEEDVNEEEDAEMYEMESGDEEEEEEEEEVAEDEEIASNEEEEDEEADEEAEVEEEYDEEEEEMEEQLEEEHLDEEEEEEEDLMDQEDEEEGDYCRDDEVEDEEEEEDASQEEVAPRRQRAPKGASRKGASSVSSTTTTTTTKSASRSSSRVVKRKSFGLRSKSRKQSASVTFEETTTTTTATASSVKRSKRGRNGVVAMASAAGETEHQYNGAAKHMQQHLPPTNSQHNRLGAGERRTRRGGPKTDAAAADLMAHDDTSGDSVDSRSSGRQHATGASNVTGLYNVWNQMHKDSAAAAVYYRGTATTTTTVSVPRRHRK